MHCHRGVTWECVRTMVELLAPQRGGLEVSAEQAAGLAERVSAMGRKLSVMEAVRPRADAPTWLQSSLTLSGLFFYPIFTTLRQHSFYPYV